jgi:hypothetical protein
MALAARPAVLSLRAFAFVSASILVSACSDSAERDAAGAAGSGAAGSGAAGSGAAGSGGGAAGGAGGNKQLAPGECHDQADCNDAQSCGVPVDPVTCGTGATCGGDEDPACPTGWTCGPPCDCGGAGCFQSCLAPCSEVGCALGYTCQPDGICTITTCGDAADCPDTFDCSGGSCEPKQCTSDANCGPGYCVRGRCSPEPGVCAEISA